MNAKESKRPGRPRKYATDAERKRAYRQRKKEEIQKLESQVKQRITELKGRIDNMERKLLKYTYTDKELPEEIFEIHEQIKTRSIKYTPSELMEMEIDQLYRIRDTLISRYYDSYYNPLLSALELAIMPSVDKEFDSRQSSLVQASTELKLKEKLAKPKDKTTPRTNTKVDDYILKLKEEGVDLSKEDEKMIRSTMERRRDEKRKHWEAIKDPYRTDQLIDVFFELMILFEVLAEISRRERESIQEKELEKLAKKVEELEKRLSDEK
ncbi:MAG: hypothetical protein ACTSSG_07980 [Candidatus Heimdallarchaeaceae archaeon]